LKRKLFDFIEDSAHYLIEKSVILRYYQEFNLLSKPLFNLGWLTLQECDTAFMHGFHPDDCSNLLLHLIAKFLNVYSKRAYPFKDVFQTAGEVFADDEDLLFHASKSQHESSHRQPSDHRRHDRESDQDCHTQWHTWDLGSPHPEHYQWEDYGCQRRCDSPLPSAEDLDNPTSDGSCLPRTETKTVWFKKATCQKEDWELRDLIKQMHSLLVWDSDYASLYARCTYHFPNAVWDIPKPDYCLAPTLATSYTFQTVPPPMLMTMPAWSVPAPDCTPPSAPLVPPSSSFFQTSTVPSSSAPLFFCPHPHVEGCVFCLNLGHQIRFCPLAQEYISTRHAKIVEDRMCLPNGQGIPNDGLGNGLKASVDNWLATQSAPPPSTPVQTAFICDSLLHIDPRPPSACIEEVVDSHLLQVSTIMEVEVEPISDLGEDLGNIFNVFTVEHWKKCKDRTAKLPELTSPTPPTPSSSLQAPNALPHTPNPFKPSPQYQYHSNAKDQHLVSELQSLLLEGKLSHTTPTHVFAASSSIR